MKAFPRQVLLVAATVAFILCASDLALANDKSAKRPAGVAANGLALSLSAKTSNPRLGETIWMTLEIRNLSAQDAYVLIPYVAAFYDLKVIDAAGIELPRLAHSPCPVDVYSSNSNGDRIAPGTSYFTDVRLACYVQITRPGTYAVTASTRRVLRPDNRKDLGLVSNTVMIQVMP